MESPSLNGDPELLKSFHSDMEDGHQLNSYLEILQTSSSSKQTPVFMSRNLIGWIRPKRDLEMCLIFHLDTKDGHVYFFSLHGLLQTTSSKVYALLTLRIAKIATDMHNTSLYTSCLNLLLATCLHSTIIVSSYSQQQVSIIYLNTLMVSSNSDQQV